MSLPQFFKNIINKIPLYTDLKNVELFNNSGIDYMLAAITFLSSFLLIYLLKLVLVVKLKNHFNFESFNIIQTILDELETRISLALVIFTSLYLALLNLMLPSGLRLFVNVLAFGYLIYVINRLGSGFIDEAAAYRDRKTEADQTHILSLVKLLSKVTLVSLTGLWYLRLLGIDVTGLIAGIGFAGITIAFALQNIVSDLFAAIAIYLDKPFEIGDAIEVGNVTGTIEKIGLRTTHIRSVSGPLVIISNQNLTSANITNFKQMERRRVSQTIGVDAETPLPKLRSLPGDLADLAASISHVEVHKVWLKELGNYSWNFEMLYWIDTPDLNIYRDAQNDLNYKILAYMEEQDIGLPYPIQELVIRDVADEVHLESGESQNFISPLDPSN